MKEPPVLKDHGVWHKFPYLELETVGGEMGEISLRLIPPVTSLSFEQGEVPPTLAHSVLQHICLFKTAFGGEL